MNSVEVKGYLLTCTDIFSKYVWVIPFKNKTGEQITQPVTEIFQSNRIPKKIQTDQGLEFYNIKVQRLFENKGIKLFSSYSELKASVIERFNRTLKGKLENVQNYFPGGDVPDKVVINYNTSYHRSIKMSPTEASLKRTKRPPETTCSRRNVIKSQNSK